MSLSLLLLSSSLLWCLSWCLENARKQWHLIGHRHRDSQVTWLLTPPTKPLPASHPSLLSLLPPDGHRASWQGGPSRSRHPARLSLALTPVNTLHGSAAATPSKQRRQPVSHLIAHRTLPSNREDIHAAAATTSSTLLIYRQKGGVGEFRVVRGGGYFFFHVVPSTLNPGNPFSIHWPPKCMSFPNKNVPLCSHAVLPVLQRLPVLSSAARASTVLIGSVKQKWGKKISNKCDMDMCSWCYQTVCSLCEFLCLSVCVSVSVCARVCVCEGLRFHYNQDCTRPKYCNKNLGKTRQDFTRIPPCALSTIQSKRLLLNSPFFLTKTETQLCVCIDLECHWLVIF